MPRSTSRSASFICGATLIRTASSPSSVALERARERAAAELGLSVYWIFDAVRHFTVEEADRVFRKAAEMRANFPSIIGIGLGGDERRTGSAPFRASVRSREGRRTPPYQPRRRNHRPRRHLGSALYRLRAHRPCAVGDSGPKSDRGVKSAEHRTRAESNLECAHRRLPVVRCASAAAALRCRPSGHAQL